MILPILAVLALAHGGTVVPRTGPEWSDVALFGCAVLAVWFVRRALRRRARRD